MFRVPGAESKRKTIMDHLCTVSQATAIGMDPDNWSESCVPHTRTESVWFARSAGPREELLQVQIPVLRDRRTMGTT